ncbi:hypothetical protein [Streptomyces sp. NPDC007264]|uniref:hypothetical protein n=1 Tax=Streptomyces sp. NPDC007264 TaxID=3364777 RepID=UPI0036D8B6A5
MPRPALLALTFCVLATAAAVVSFARGAWVGVVWVLLAGLTSNMAWYSFRRARRGSTVSARSAAPAAAAACQERTACDACGVCEMKTR